MLINSTEELKEFIPTSISLDFADIKPYLETAEVKIASDFLTIPILDFLTSQGLNATETKIKNLVSGSVALLALRSYLDFGQLTVTSSGIHFNSSENTKTAFEWQIANLKKACLIECYTKIELLYPLLPTTTDPFKTLFNSSPQLAIINTLLLNSTREFSKYASIGNSNVFYFKLLNSISEAEQFLKEQLTEALFDLLKTPAGEAPKLAAIQKIKLKAGKFCAYSSLSEGVIENVSILGEFGVQLFNATSSRMMDAKLSTTDKMLETLRTYYENQAEKSLSELLNLCQKLAEIVPEFKDSENYLQPEETHIARNQPDASIIFL
jgi:hypothetical protein